MNRENEAQVNERESLYTRRYRRKIEVIERNVKLSDEEKLEALENLLAKFEKKYEKIDDNVEPSKAMAIVMFLLGTSVASDVFNKITDSNSFQNLGDVEQFFAGAGSLLGGAAAGVAVLLAASFAYVPVQFLKEHLANKKCDSLNDVMKELRIIIAGYSAKANQQASQK